MAVAADSVETSGWRLAGSTLRVREGLDKHSSSLLPLNGDIDGATNGAGTMHLAGRDHQTLPGAENAFVPTVELYVQFTFHYQEQLVRIRVRMPGVLALENRESHTRAIHVEQDLIPVRLEHLLLHRLQVDECKRTESRSFRRVMFCRGEIRFHTASFCE
jgi:hypothetical protein